MQITKREIVKEVEDMRISVIHYKDGTFEIAPLYKNFSGKWEIDYSIFEDVFKCWFRIKFVQKCLTNVHFLLN